MGTLTASTADRRARAGSAQRLDILIDGTLSEVDDDRADGLARMVDPWLRKPRPHVLLLRATQVTGRRLIPRGGAVQVVDLGADRPTDTRDGAATDTGCTGA